MKQTDKSTHAVEMPWKWPKSINQAIKSKRTTKQMRCSHGRIKTKTGNVFYRSKHSLFSVQVSTCWLLHEREIEKRTATTTTKFVIVICVFCIYFCVHLCERVPVLSFRSLAIRANVCVYDVRFHVFNISAYDSLSDMFVTICGRCPCVSYICVRVNKCYFRVLFVPLLFTFPFSLSFSTFMFMCRCQWSTCFLPKT